MASERLILVSGDRATSEDGLAAWLVLRLSGLAFEHRVEFEREGRFASLHVDGDRIDHSMAIASFVAELVPGIWPGDPRVRAVAYSFAAEAYGGFRSFRTFLPLSLGEQFMPSAQLLRRVAKERERLTERWQEVRSVRTHGDFLFGEFCAADAFQASLAARFVTYGLEVDDPTESYVDAVMSFPFVAEWQALAAEGDNSVKSYAGSAPETAFETARPLPVEVETVIDEPVIVEPKDDVDPEPELLEPDWTPPREPADIAGSDPPFKVDLAGQGESEQDEDFEPLLLQPAPGNRLFRNAGNRLFKPNFQQPEVEKPEVGEANADRPVERPSRPAGIKPIGGEIRRRR